MPEIKQPSEQTPHSDTPLAYTFGNYTTPPVRLESGLDHTAFDLGYYGGCEEWIEAGTWSNLKIYDPRYTETVGRWFGYCDGRHHVQRDYMWAAVEAYNDAVRLLRGELPELVASPILLPEFFTGYCHGMEIGKMSPHGKLSDEQSAYSLGLRKAQIDLGRNCDRRQAIVLAYNEAEGEARRLGFQNYGWSHGPLPTPPRVVEETTGSHYFFSGVAA